MVTVSSSEIESILSRLKNATIAYERAVSNLRSSISAFKSLEMQEQQRVNTGNYNNQSFSANYRTGAGSQNSSLIAAENSVGGAQKEVYRHQDVLKGLMYEGDILIKKLEEIIRTRETDKYKIQNAASNINTGKRELTEVEKSIIPALIRELKDWEQQLKQALDHAGKMLSTPLPSMPQSTGSGSNLGNIVNSGYTRNSQNIQTNYNFQPAYFKQEPYLGKGNYEPVSWYQKIIFNQIAVSPQYNFFKTNDEIGNAHKAYIFKPTYQTFSKTIYNENSGKEYLSNSIDRIVRGLDDYRR